MISEINRHDFFSILLGVVIVKRMREKIVLNEQEILYFTNVVDMPFFLSIQEDIVTKISENFLSNR